VECTLLIIQTVRMLARGRITSLLSPKLTLLSTMVWYLTPTSFILKANYVSWA